MNLGFDSEVELDNSVIDQMHINNHKKTTLMKSNKLIMKSETDLEIVQIQILELLAQLDINTCLGLLDESKRVLSYPSISIINYKLSFNDCKINISFGE